MNSGESRLARGAQTVLFSLLAACSGGDGGSDSPGGFVRVEHRVNGSGVPATFARAEFTDVVTTRPKRGRCTVPDDAGMGTWRDVGAAITLSRAGADPLVLPRATLGSLMVYGADGLPASDSPARAEFDVSLDGTDEIDARTWESAIEIPEPLEPDEIVNQIGFSVDQPFSWGPSTAEEVLVEIASGGHVDLVCRAKGSDGQVIVPEVQNSELDSGGGTVTYRVVHRQHSTLDGDAVALEGQSTVIVPYQ